MIGLYNHGLVSVKVGMSQASRLVLWSSSLDTASARAAGITGWVPPKPGANRRCRTERGRASKASTEQLITCFTSGERLLKMAKASLSSWLAGDWPNRNRRASWKKEAASTLGTALSLKGANFSSRLCLGLCPMASGTQEPMVGVVGQATGVQLEEQPPPQLKFICTLSVQAMFT